ncbi:serine/threonine protein kinase [Metamycoplasma phocicerebrale]|uniref:Serine/threonine protein kinase n=1 Tax=Metamycoplasma phocicerebrale TaxID=142649 RepID=A0A3Q9V8R4_9BACT|nr:serine/threonine-protein kinase [Metamycoplasma phocicerebrale]AZZ65674.1 serine/threonine protein kinase [Metamycoplasma phocicerebrale]
MEKKLRKYRNVNKYFENFELIGRGGYGEVYSATYVKTGKKVAIKILTVPDITKKVTNQIRFKNECKVLNMIRSDNVVKMIGYYSSNDESYYVMELIKGIDLKSLIAKNTKIPTDEAIRIAKEICQGLIDIHLVNVIHRDLKPSNIIIQNITNTIKLIDFGISISEESVRVTADNKVVGSIQYIAPELLTRTARASVKSDIYAFGMILYEMLAGHPPFQANEEQSILYLQINQKLPPLEGVGVSIPQAVENIIIRCTAKNPNLRYDNCVDILKDLKKCLSPQASLEKKLKLDKESKNTNSKNKKKSLSLKVTLIIIILLSVAIVATVLALVFTGTI